ncbi:MAG: fimbrillin family protein [Rikenellaceae bacterium]
MKHTILIALALSAVMAAGCSKSDTPAPSTPDGYEPSTSAISFQTELNWGDDEPTTRGFATETKNFTSFGVLAYYGDKDDDIATLTPNFMYDQEVTKGSDDDVWGYSPIKYWPNNTNDRMQFFAYHPYGSGEIVLSKNNATGYPTFTVTPAEKPYDQDDFIFDYTNKLSKSETGVEFSFKHRLAQARVYAARLGAEDDGETVQILGMKVSGYVATGELKYDDTQDDFVWNIPDEETTATYSFNSQELSDEIYLPPLNVATAEVSDYTALGYGQGQSYMMLIPDDAVGELNFSVLFSYFDGTSKAQAYQEFVLKEGSTLVEGEIKIYLLLVDPSDVGFGTINVTSQPWLEETISGDGDDGKWEIE